MRNVIQFASGFAALGCILDFDTTTGEMTVTDVPKEFRKTVHAALEDIEYYETTSNYGDGIAIFALANTVDGSDNPIRHSDRNRILHRILGYANPDGKFYRSVINDIKVHRSWHSSKESNTCTYFGSICTNRGVDIPEGKRGRKSYRSPDQFHLASSRGIAREQLVTPNLQALYDTIPEGNCTSSNNKKPVNIESLIKTLSPEEAAILIERLKEISK